MVHKYPPTEEELQQHREFIPASELKFYCLLDGLGDDWHAWHSVRWDKKRSIQSGEADYLLFNPNLGFIVIEVKGGVISVKDGLFYSQNTRTFEVSPLKDPFGQAETSMYHIRDYYVQKARSAPNAHQLLKDGRFFPLSFEHAVFFPDTQFKKGFEYMQYQFPKIFDESDSEDQLQWQGDRKTEKSPLEMFLIKLLAPYKKYRMSNSSITEFFLELIGSNISRFLNLKKYYEIRNEELEEINQVQDFLLDALSAKTRCIFKGSAGSGKTFLAMKKALRLYADKKNTLLLCFNSELRHSIQEYVSTRLERTYDKIKGRLSVYSIHLFLTTLIKAMFDGDTQRKLETALSEFSYEAIANEIKTHKDQIPISYFFDAILIDEAQDIEVHLRKVLPYFLKDPEESLFYVFYDEAQALFAKDFAVEDFGLDERSDLIVLNRNLRNTVQIANWLHNNTSLGHYTELSGINGFKITARKYESAKLAVMNAMNVIKKQYLTHGISPDKITVLSYYKLGTLVPGVKTNRFCDYYTLVEKSTGDRIFLVEPNTLEEMDSIKCLKEIDCEWCITFKTISGFKGLESDILFLVLPNLEEFKQNHPDKYENYVMQIYVGASRAKFKLYLFEY